ncbi:unnamed protein product [Nesidiocoris tenuis]|uniref:Uncharacterized protein n=1 Tax=Nesidiocoris tenuis TaxID=355587 RepID=A0A6H5H684_9HEMI|nr:unnamed protein product [Nesidiocoris tenuis]
MPPPELVNVGPPPAKWEQLVYIWPPSSWSFARLGDTFCELVLRKICEQILVPGEMTNPYGRNHYQRCPS